MNDHIEVNMWVTQIKKKTTFKYQEIAQFRYQFQFRQVCQTQNHFHREKPYELDFIVDEM
jgi:hypothetical protein